MSEHATRLETPTAWALPDVGTEAHSEDYCEDDTLIPPTAEEVAAWEEEARTRGYSEGHKEGYQAGFDAGSAKIDEQGALFAQLLEALEQPFTQLDEQVEQELMQLVVALAQQLVRREIRSEPGEIIGVIREAMVLLPANKQQVSIQLHPEDAALLREALSTNDSENNWTLQEDPLISRGGCRISTDVSQLDATLESRLASLAATMLGGERESD